MKQYKLFYISIVILLLLGMTYQTKPYKLQASTEERITNKIAMPPGMPTQKVTRTQTYIEREPIFITSDSDLNDSKVTGFTGNGTIDDPIMIENYNITDDDDTLVGLIDIRSTTYYFCITNCLINGLGTSVNGIYVNNVTHGTITNNTIYNGLSGVNVASRSNFNVVANNTIFNNREDGIRLGEANPSHNNTVFNNTIYNNGWSGIRVDASDNNTIEYNTIYDNGGIGIELDSSSSNIMTNNTIHSCSGGIELLSSSWNTVSNNTVYNVVYAGMHIVEFSSQNFVSDNKFFNNDNGISIRNSSHNTIVSNTAYNSFWQGISSRDSNFSTISRNTVYNSSGSGIYLRRDTYGEVTENICYENSFRSRPGEPNYDNEYQTGGITVIGHSLQVTNNSVFNNWHNGILVYWAVDVNVSHNVVTNNTRNGITVGESNTTIIEGNEVSENTKNGILVGTLTNNSVIHDNTIYDNRNYGLAIGSDCSDNIVTWNDFIQNNPSGDSQAKDDGNNDFDGNFWDEWISPDANIDGIVDEKYPLDGDAQNFDHTPLTQPRNLIGIHFVSRAVLIFPSGGETLVGVITIQWTTPIDSSGHSFTYELFYSNDGGATWTSIVSELTDTSYPWNTTTVPNGLSYLIKVKTTCSEGESSEGISEGTFEIRNELKTTTTATSATSDGVPGIPGILAVICLVSFVLLRKGRKK